MRGRRGLIGRASALYPNLQSFPWRVSRRCYRLKNEHVSVFVVQYTKNVCKCKMVAKKALPSGRAFETPWEAYCRENPKIGKRIKKS